MSKTNDRAKRDVDEGYQKVGNFVRTGLNMMLNFQLEASF